MADRCGAVHPEDSTRVCILKGTGHGDHVDGSGKPWTDHQRVEQVKANTQTRRSKKRSATMRSITKRARDGKRRIIAGDEGPGLDPQIVGVWQQDEWQTYAGPIVERFLTECPTEFTTAEDVWPLLEKPEEMRAMSVLVQSLLRAGWIEEVAAKRLRGTYHTKDGHEFAENKLVPVYRSKICRQSNLAIWGESSHDSVNS